MARHVGGALAPQRQHVEGLAHRAVLAPQHAQRLRQLPAGSDVGAVVRQVDGGGGAVVLADGFGRARNAGAALVLGQHLGRERRQARMAPAHHAAHVAHRVGGDQRLGQRRRLDQEEPVPVGLGKGLGRVLVHGERGRDVEQQHPLDRRRMVAANRCATRAPRSWASTPKRSKPWCCMAASASRAISRLL
jgi:hypothetical protein